MSFDGLGVKRLAWVQSEVQKFNRVRADGESLRKASNESTDPSGSGHKKKQRSPFLPMKYATPQGKDKTLWVSVSMEYIWYISQQLYPS